MIIKNTSLKCEKSQLNSKKVKSELLWFKGEWLCGRVKLKIKAFEW